jgi:hypothetical protein
MKGHGTSLASDPAVVHGRDLMKEKELSLAGSMNNQVRCYLREREDNRAPDDGQPDVGHRGPDWGTFDQWLRGS